MKPKKQKIKRPGLLTRMLQRYYRSKLKANEAIADDALEIINPREALVIRTEMIVIIVISAFLGVMGVVALYVPKYIFPEFFSQKISMVLPWIGNMEVEWIFMLYSVILAQIEAWLLVYYNARSVARISNANGFPVLNAPDFEKHLHSLVVVALEKKDRTIRQFGIDPYYGMSRFGLFIYMLLNRFKATLSNIFVKLVVGRVLGRAVLRIYIDFLGLLVYPAWNVWASIMVIKEARIRIMAPNLIKGLADRMAKEFSEQKEYPELLFHTLSFISQVKRNYNFNLYLLSDALIERFQIKKAKTLLSIPSFIEKLNALPFAERNSLLRLIVFGMLIDGSLTKKEKSILSRLYNEKVLTVTLQTICTWSTAYLTGKGMSGFSSHYNFGLGEDTADQA